MPWLVRDGIRLYHETCGEGGGRWPVLLTHGMASTSRSWEPNLGALSEQRKIITWDMRGHGQSDYPGGYMTLAFHLAHRDRVAGIMLFDTGPGFKQAAVRDAWNARAERTAEALETQGLGGLPRSAEGQGSAHRDASGLARAARGMLKQADARVIESLPSISVPALVLVGERDRPFLAAADYMAGKIPGAEQVVVPGAGHASNVDQPEAFNRSVTEFLDGLPG